MRLPTHENSQLQHCTSKYYCVFILLMCDWIKISFCLEWFYTDGGAKLTQNIQYVAVGLFKHNVHFHNLKI